MWGGSQHMILASVPPSQTHLPCLHSQIHHLLSLDTQLKYGPLKEEWNFGTQKV